MQDNEHASRQQHDQHRIPVERLENYVRAHARWTLAGMQFDEDVRPPDAVVEHYVTARNDLRIAAEELLRAS